MNDREVTFTIDEPSQKKELVNHPNHYGGKDNPYEAIKVITAWDLNFSLGNCLKYIRRAKLKGNELEDLKKALWYLQNHINNLENDRPTNISDRVTY